MHLRNLTTESRLRLDAPVRAFHAWIRKTPLPNYVPDMERASDARQSELLYLMFARKCAQLAES